MEEKERYEVSVGSDYITITDYDKNELRAFNNKHLQDLLNHQDKEMKQTKENLSKFGNIISKQDTRIKDLEEENTQLKQQLHDLPKKIVSEIRKKIGNKLYRIIPEGEYGSRLGIDWCEINRLLDTILKKYGGVEK